MKKVKTYLRHDKIRIEESGRVMMIQRMYVDAPYLSPLLNWLSARPTGKCHVVIGNLRQPSALPQKLLIEAFQRDSTLAEWLLAKIFAEELDIQIQEDISTLEPTVIIPTQSEEHWEH